MIIRSILDNDLYKFTTSYAYAQCYPHAEGEFQFTDRNDLIYPAGFAEKMREQIAQMATLRLRMEEETFVKGNIRFLPPPYIDFLKGFQYNPEEVTVEQDSKGRLSVKVVGNLYRVTLWEVPLLSIISELYYQMLGIDAPDVERQTEEKAALLNKGEVKYSEFGTRRRFSFDVQDRVVKVLKEKSEGLVGTSNVYLAMKHGLSASGTFPHEWIQFHGANFGYRMGNYQGLEAWKTVYHGDLGIALADTFTSKVFFENFSKMHAKLFDGLRQDSGSPFEFVDQALARYEELYVDAQSKTIIFSDSLTSEKAGAIRAYCEGKIRPLFGIGTHLTNDFGPKAMNIVIKLKACRMTPRQKWLGCVKLSDVAGKESGKIKDIALCKKILELN